MASKLWVVWMQGVVDCVSHLSELQDGEVRRGAEWGQEVVGEVGEEGSLGCTDGCVEYVEAGPRGGGELRCWR